MDGQIFSRCDRVGYDSTFLHLDDPVSKVEYSVVVGNHKDCRIPLVGKLTQHADHTSAAFCIQSRRRFVGKDDLRIPDQSPRDRNALLLSPGKLVRQEVNPFGEPH